MDQLNLNLYVEQVNHNADTAVLEQWKEENVEQALSSVVDPNTEFKTGICTSSSITASPSDSYGLNSNGQASEKLSAAPVTADTKEAAEEGFPKRRQKKHFHDSTQLAKVHAYGSSHSNTPSKEMNTSPELIKFPADRITIVTDNGPVLKSGMSKASSQESLHLSQQPVTNSEQLTWILQRARDRLDTASNISGCSSRFDLDSNCSEKVETMSTISDVSGYEEEMYRIKRLLLLDSNASTPTPIPTPVHKEKYDNEVQKLTTELQKVKAEWQEKHQEALRQKAHTEGRLEIVQVEMLESRDQESALKAEVSKLQQSLRDLSAKLELRGVEVERLRNESQNVEQQNERLRIELQEVRIDVESKEGAISGLKSKVADQHVEFQDLYQAKLKAENNLSSLQNELESVRKSNMWYRDQLHACQSAKMKVQQELMASQSSTVSLMHQLEKLKGESAGLHLIVEQTQLQAVREKEVLMRKLEAIQADMLEREAVMLNQFQHSEPSTSAADLVTFRTMKDGEKSHLVQLQELQDQVSSLTLQTRAKEAILSQMESKNTELLTRFTVLQKMLNEKEVAVQMLENKYRNVEMSQNQLIDALKLKEDALLEARNGKVSAEVALAAAEREKAEVDAAVTKLREDFTRVTQSYKSMKEEVREKDKKITNLMNEMGSMVKEKHKLKEKLEQYKDVQSQILQLKSHESEIIQLTEYNRDLSNKIREINEANKCVKGKLANVEEALAAREEQLLNQSHSLEVQHTEINQLQIEKEIKEKELKKQAEEHKTELEVLSVANRNLMVKINELNEKVLRLENNLETAKENLIKQKSEMEAQNNEKERLVSRIQDLELSNIRLTDHAGLLEKQLVSANTAIEQFNLLCRQSEQDRHLISDELQKVLKENETLKSTTECFSGPENGLINNGSYKMNELMEKMELELFAMMDMYKDGNVKVEKVPDLKHVFSKLIVMQDLLSKVVNVKESALQENGNAQMMQKLMNNATCKVENKRQCVNVGTQNDVLLQSDVNLQTEVMTNIENATQTYNDFSCVCAETQTENEQFTETANGCDTQKDQIQSLERQVVNLKASLRMCELEQREKHRCYEVNVRTLLKKVKEHMKGRKAAERALEELKNHGEMARLQAELEEMQKLANKNQQTILELEKERGKLVQTQDDLVPAHKLEHTAELEEEIHKSHIIIKDLRKEMFSDKCELSQLKKQLASLQMGLETANDMLDAKKVELGRTESWCYVLRSDVTRLKKELETEQQAHEECRQELEKLRAELEESKAKDPVLADQLKTLSYHLHQKNQEIISLEEKLKLSEERCQSTENSLRVNIGALQDEMNNLHSELDLVRKDKIALQQHAAELRTALHSGMENNKILRAKFEKYESDNKERMPDLTSSLPMPPLEYDETKIAELLQQNSMLPRSKPLSNLQACLDSLKQEMATLQQQLIAKTLPKETGAPCSNS